MTEPLRVKQMTNVGEVVAGLPFDRKVLVEFTTGAKLEGIIRCLSHATDGDGHYSGPPREDGATRLEWYCEIESLRSGDVYCGIINYVVAEKPKHPGELTAVEGQFTLKYRAAMPATA